jgi:hypothetical protein
MITRRQEQEWAKIGARTRLEELEQERRAILARYPELAESPRRRPGGSRPGRKLSAAAKRRMKAGMRKWWAKRKAAAKRKGRAKP